MTLTVTPTVTDAFTTLRAFILDVLSPVGSTPLPVIQLPVNRAAMPPPVPGFVGMRRRQNSRIMTNLDKWDEQDVNPSAIAIEQAMMFSVQLDCYGANADQWAVILSTVLRDEYGVTALSPVLSPLYTSDPRFAPLTNAEAQYESRWIVEAFLQYNPVVTTPMQFADTAEIALINVDERYPPT